MNIAGPVKNSPSIYRAYQHGLDELLRSLPENKILFRSSRSDHCGCLTLISIDLDARYVKDICISIEESSHLGRLYDIDVIDPSGNKLDRAVERSCIVCGTPGRGCAAGRLHPIDEIISVTNRVIDEHFCTLDSASIAKIAEKSLILEVETTPKPGLVDLNNSGSHTDMDVGTFRKSATALVPYFSKCFEIGAETKKQTAEATFLELRAAGLMAEKAMYEATGGINTHKGVIYSLGVLLGAIGRLWTAGRPIADISRILTEASILVQKSPAVDFDIASGATAGERLFIQRGLTGIRGEVASGFSSVVNHSLPIYEAGIADELSQNDAGVQALLKLISIIEDTNVYHRGGAGGAQFAKQYAASLLSSTFDQNAVNQMDDEFIKRNLSPGGAADLLAITYFLDMIKREDFIL